jgi:hypothetical protein
MSPAYLRPLRFQICPLDPTNSVQPQVLQAWSDQAAGGSFTTSVAQMTALYAHMLDLLEHNPSSIPSASAAFLERPLIWVPDRAALPRPDAATWASAGRPAAAAPQGGGGGWGMLGDPYAVQSDYGFWPDGGAGRQRPEGPKHAGKQLPGRFYEPGLVRWFDATGLLEALPQETIHTRVLAHAYGAACAPVQALFTRALQRPRGGGGGGAAAEGGAWQQQGEQRRAVPLVLVNETIPDCLRALEAVAAGTPEVTADSEAFRQVRGMCGAPGGASQGRARMAAASWSWIEQEERRIDLAAARTIEGVCSAPSSPAQIAAASPSWG